MQSALIFVYECVWWTVVVVSFAGIDVLVSQCSCRDVKRNLKACTNVTCSVHVCNCAPKCDVTRTRSRFTCSQTSLITSKEQTWVWRCENTRCIHVVTAKGIKGIIFDGFRDSPTVWCICAFFPILPQFYVPFYMKKRKMDNFMCLLEYKCAKRLRAHSQAIPVG